MGKSANSVNFKQYESKMRFYKFAVALLTPVLKAIFRIKIEGAENIPQTGDIYVCCNHLSNWDPILLAVSSRRPIHYMSKKEVFKIPVIKSLLSLLGAFPVDRDNVDITAVKTALTHIKYKNAIGIFIQGTRCTGKDPESIGAKSGVGMLVYKTMSDVIPVSIYTKGYKVVPFKKVYVTIGKPIKYDEFSVGEKSPEEYQRMSNFVFDRICGMARAKKEALENEK